MSKFLLMGMAGYLLGMKHQWMCRRFCGAKIWRKAKRMLRA